MAARADSPTGIQEHVDTKERGFHDTKSPYCLPNDSEEHERLFSQSNGVAAIFGGRMSHAPISRDSKPPTKMLDIGCGTGSVSLYLGETYPTAYVYGLDLSKVPDISQRQAAEKQRNVKFVRDNYMEAVVGSPGPTDEAKDLWQPNSYDLIFGRALILGIENWDLYFQKAFQLLKPGGWVEDQDVDQTMLTYPDRRNLEDEEEWEWLRVLRKYETEAGIDADAGKNAAERMRKAGFVDVRVEKYVWPFVKIEELPETWALAEHCQRTHKDIMQTALKKLIEGKLPKEKVDKYVADLDRLMFSAPGVHYPFYVTLGRKPDK
ncbi:S-adenosyl-L-methionine-dependent methyltransferase [Phyllosticta citribraziliensis]|uniref:S-adenosyl-L-methionine-dependent methyltransferase n=1 Tax=Phyllosticta citribraziliensis TaxID=989973 RepID=A0ABR1L507_9PEZI